jgi:phosphoribosylformylglycinamidine synthase
MKAKVTVTLKPGVLDPQGRAIEGALKSLGWKGVKGVRVGKSIELEIDEKDTESAKAAVQKMCEKLLANPVTEKYQIEIIPDR